MPTTSQIFARRAGRIAFGLVLLVGVASLAAAAWSGSVGSHSPACWGAARLVGLTWLAAILAGAVVRAIAARLRWRPAAEALFAESVMVPTAGIALLLPITLHLPVVVVVASAGTFDFWVAASLWITGAAHVVFAGLCAPARWSLAGSPSHRARSTSRPCSPPACRSCCCGPSRPCSSRSPRCRSCRCCTRCSAGSTASAPRSPPHRTCRARSPCCRGAAPDPDARAMTRPCTLPWSPRCTRSIPRSPT